MTNEQIERIGVLEIGFEGDAISFQHRGADGRANGAGGVLAPMSPQDFAGWLKAEIDRYRPRRVVADARGVGMAYIAEFNARFPGQPIELLYVPVASGVSSLGSQAVAQARPTFAGKLDLLDKLYAALPGLQAAGVRKLEATEHGFVVELERVEQPDGEPEPPDPRRGDDLDTAHVDG